MSTMKKADSPVSGQSSSSQLVPVAPESSGSGVAKKRKRLAKAFSRPLDKKLKEVSLARVKISIREDLYAQLVTLQQRLIGLGVAMKKGDVLRASIVLLESFDDGDFQQALVKRRANG